MGLISTPIRCAKLADRFIPDVSEHPPDTKFESRTSRGPSQPVDDAHDVEMMTMTLDMMSLPRLNHLVGCIDGAEKEVRPSQQHTQPESQATPAHGRGRG